MSQSQPSGVLPSEGTEPLDLAKLEEVALAATPGPWEATGGNVTNWHDHTYEMEWMSNGQGCIDGTNANYRADAIHIATFDPPTVLRLIAELKEAGLYTEAHERLDDLARDSVRLADSAISLLLRCVSAVGGGAYRDRAALSVSMHPAFEAARNWLSDQAVKS